MQTQTAQSVQALSRPRWLEDLESRHNAPSPPAAGWNHSRSGDFASAERPGLPESSVESRLAGVLARLAPSWSCHARQSDAHVSRCEPRGPFPLLMEWTQASLGIVPRLHRGAYLVTRRCDGSLRRQCLAGVLFIPLWVLTPACRNAPRDLVPEYFAEFPKFGCAASPKWRLLRPTRGERRIADLHKARVTRPLGMDAQPHGSSL